MPHEAPRACGAARQRDAQDQEPASAGVEPRLTLLKPEPLVGRVAELAALEAALASPDGVAARAAVLHGPSGYGKTTLARALASRAAGRGTSVVWVDGRADDTTRPLKPWIDALARCHLGAPAPADTDGLLSALEDIGGSCLVVLDEADMATDAVLEPLLSLSRRLPSIPLLVICRSTGWGPSRLLQQRLALLGLARTCAFVALEALPRGTAKTIVRAIGGHALSAADEEAICRRAAGDPFLLTELARHASSGAPAVGPLPAAVRGTIGLRLAALAPPVRALVERACLFSGAFSLGWLRAASGLAEDDVRSGIEEASLYALLAPAAGGGWVVAAPAIVDVLLGERAPDDRAQLHRAVAEALETLPKMDRRAAAQELTAQYLASARLGATERGVSHALEASAQAERQGQSDLALTLLRSAVELTRTASAPLKAAACTALARAYARRLALPQALTARETAMRLLRASGASPAEIADTACTAGSLLRAPLAAISPEALERTVGDPAQLDEIRRARLALVMRRQRWEAAGPLRIARLEPEDARASELLMAEGSAADRVLTAAGLEPLDASRFERRLGRLTAIDDPQLRGLGLLALGLRTLSMQVDPSLVETMLDEAERGTRGPALRHAAAAVKALRAASLGRAGRLSEALALAEESSRELGRWPATTLTPSLPLLIQLLTERHLDPDWQVMAARAWKLATATDPPAHFSLALACLTACARAHAGEAAGAALVLRDAVPALERTQSHESFAGCGLALAAEAVAVLGDTRLAGVLQRLALRLRAGGAGNFYLCQADMTVARLESVLGHDDASAAAYERARVALHVGGERTLGAIVDFEQGAILAAQDDDAANALLDSALRQFDEMGMTVWRRRLGAGDRAIGAHGLTRRQLEVLRLLAAGLTSREIADRLVISVHTVDRHVRDIYLRLGTRNRAEATAYAVRIGL